MSLLPGAHFSMQRRDEFKKPVLRLIADRVGHHCSNPDCRRQTSGPDSTENGSTNMGVGAHITAAATGGPRFDPQLSAAERSSPANGIWLCPECAHLIDRDVTRYTKAVLLNWKLSAEERARSRLQSPERPQGPDEPILTLPSADPAISWLPFSARATALVGRDAERAALNSFLRSNERFSWWLLAGAAGAGKSRLALELCRDARPEWNAGFLGRADKFDRWSYFRPSRPTLVVVDYVASRAEDVSVLALQLARSAEFFPNSVRLLLIERDQGSWWSRFLREESQSESTEIIACQHGDPLCLGPLAAEALQSLAADTARFQQIPWTEAMARSFQRRMRTLDPLGRPLFAMMAAAYSASEAPDAVVDSTLLRVILKKEASRRRVLIPEENGLRKMENLITLATLVGGVLPKSGGFAFLTDTEVAALLPETELLNLAVFRELVAATSGDSLLPGLQPDILGERFVLDRLAPRSGVDGNTKRLLAAVWILQPEDLCEFIVRTATDFPGDTGLDLLLELSLESVGARARWARLVGDLVRVAKRSADSRTQRLLGKLRRLAAERPDERHVHVALARAEFYLGNIFLFFEHNPDKAATQFKTALSHADGDTEIEAGVMNNRGILHDQLEEEDEAFAAWSLVIAKAGVSDEARACSLNNRADIFSRRGAHDDAIRDRSQVLQLPVTSPDRRYIALIRRSRSYVDIGRTTDALRDLETILNTDDIAVEQKAEALLERGVLRRRLGWIAEARNDLELVLATDEVFPGTYADALVELGELARLEPDADRAREYIEAAARATDVRDATLVEALIVRARLLTDENDRAGAESLWQSILASPSATARQRSIAASRGAAGSSSKC